MKFFKKLMVIAVAITLCFQFFINTNDLNAVSRVGTCNFSGHRNKNAVVNVGKGNRNYFAHTNATAQLVKVTANKLSLHTASEGKSRYCKDEANVKGTEDRNLDKGHAIADSLGGVSNAYNVTPQSSKVNRIGGAQYKMEQAIRSALKAHHSITKFVYNIHYKNKSTMIPDKYYGSYLDNGKLKKFSFLNKYVPSRNSTSRKTTHVVTTSKSSSSSSYHWGANHTRCYMYGHRGSVATSLCRGL